MKRLFANCEEFGGDFHREIKTNLATAKKLDIATGYVSEDILNEFHQPLADITARQGRVRILVGMAFYEGIRARTLEQLKRIDEVIQSVKSGGGVYVATARKFHGKIYRVEASPTNIQSYVGSSNFSRSGLMGNLECTLKISDTSVQDEISKYLGFLFDPENAAGIRKAELVVPGSEAYKKRVSIERLKDLERYNVKNIQINPEKGFVFPLARLAKSEKSGLNVYFGRGRLSRRTGIVAPRPWYEVELIAPAELQKNPYYPKGQFTAYTDDGYVLPMYTGGDNFKNIRSKHDLELLGEWIKSRLQDAKALELLEPVTEETFEKFGTDKIEFYELRPREYFMRFSPQKFASKKTGDDSVG